MEDPYKTLNVARTATDKEIRSAYHKLAKQHHPDLHPGDKDAETRFKAVSAAYALLSDAEKRARFDRGEIDAAGNEAPSRRYWRGYAEREANPYAAQEGAASAEELNDFLNDIFGGFGDRDGMRAQTVRARGSDVSYSLRVGLREAAEGTAKTVTMPDGRTLKITIPAGLRDGQSLRLKGQGMPGYGGGPAGDAHIEVRVDPDAVFERRDDDIHIEMPISLPEAVLGGRVEAPTLVGPVTLTIPKGSNHGTTLRLKGKGVRNAKTGERGDQYVRLRVVLPPQPDPELTAFLEKWSASHPYDPRAGWGRPR